MSADQFVEPNKMVDDSGYELPITRTLACVDPIELARLRAASAELANLRALALAVREANVNLAKARDDRDRSLVGSLEEAYQAQLDSLAAKARLRAATEALVAAATPEAKP